MGLTGTLPPNIGEMAKLTSLVLIGCSFSGSIPVSIGSLQQLVTLSLNSNGFTGKVPATIGNLKNLYWLDLSDNKLSGSIPVSDGTTPGLDQLLHTKHFHFGKNQLSGTIPPSLFSSEMSIIHALFDNNKFTGSIPSTLGLVTTLATLRFDRNMFSGPLPLNLNNLTRVNELVLSNNALSGPIPDLTGMSNLNYLDISNNSFVSSGVPLWLSSLQSLTTVNMERTGLVGELPDKIFSVPQLQTVLLKSNQINGTFQIGSTYSSQLQLINLQNNSIGAITVALAYNFTLVLADNPFCEQTNILSAYCQSQKKSRPSYSTPRSCLTHSCPSNQTLSPTCNCAYPYAGTFTLRAPSFSDLGGESYLLELQKSMLQSFGNLSLPLDSISLSNATVDFFGNLNMNLEMYPRGQNCFNTTGLPSVASVLSQQIYKPPKAFGPYGFNAGNDYSNFVGKCSSSHTGKLVGAVIGGCVLLILLGSAGGYAFHQKKRVDRAKKKANPFVSWDSQGAGGDTPQLKGIRFFWFGELQRCTNNFSEGNNIGSGGYGKVYKGVLADGQIVAVKRSQIGSMQGSREFKNEIELLSRVHHKNLVKLVGFCFDQDEQMLVYEYVPNGTLMDSLSGKSGIQMDWIRRLKVTLGSARGLQYLHELADPPIIHRDIKSNNILLDECLVAKVADFGLSKLFGDTEKGYVTTQVKGTMGYMDPEYFMTNQLTEKSDVFSFGVVMLEMVTARRPIQQGKFIVKEVKALLDNTKDLYNLNEITDPVLLSATTMLIGFERFVDLALKCVVESGENRPTMGEVVKELENILQLAGLNPNSESAPVSQNYEAEGGGNLRHPYTDDSLQYSRNDRPQVSLI